MIKVLIEINRFLNAFLIDLLSEIAVPIEQTDRNEIQIEIAGRFAMVAGKDAQATGVIRDRFVETEFGGKIGNRIFDCAASARFSVGIVASKIFLEFFKNLVEVAEKIFVLSEFLQPGLPRKLQHADGIVICAVPQLGIEMPEEPARGWLPSPPKIVSQFTEWFQHLRQSGRHVERLYRLH